MMVQRCCLVQRHSSGSRIAYTDDIVRIAKRFPQIPQASRAPQPGSGAVWAFAGGAASKLFHEERCSVVSLKDGRQRSFSNDINRTRSCKDLDLCILSGQDPFIKDSGIMPIVPFFRRYMTEDGVCIETTRRWFFYSPPPGQIDLVAADVGGTRIVCVGPECLSATHFKAIVEGRTSSTRDVFHAMMDFADFDMDLLESHIRRMPVARAFNPDEIRQILAAVRDGWQGIREPSLRGLKRYFSTNFASGQVYENMDVQTLRYLASGVGSLATASERGLDTVHTDVNDEQSFWQEVFSGMGLKRSHVDSIIEHAREAPSEEHRINNLLAIAVSIGKLDKALKTIGGNGCNTVEMKKLGHKLKRIMVMQLQSDFNHLHPLKNTFRGLMTILEEMARHNLIMGEAFFFTDLPGMMGWLIRDTKKIHTLRLDNDA